MKKPSKLQFGILILLLIIPATCRAQLGLMEISVVNFYGTNGSGPIGDLVQRIDGLLYGTTVEGGDFGQGTIFKTRLDGSLTTLFSFNGTNGAYPSSALLPVPDGGSYGITTYGGNGFNGSYASGQGTIYQLGSNGVLNTLFAFNGTNGFEPNSLTFGSDGNLYGTTFSGGAFTNDPVNPGGDGIAFELTTNGQFTLLASFYGTNGNFPVSLIQAVDGNFYGVTERGGTSDLGTVFQMTPNGEVTSLFSFNGTNGTGPQTLIQGSDGSLYGTTVFGGSGFNGTLVSGDGTIFRITTNGDFTTLGLLNATTTGGEPIGRLLEVSNGVFYGTARAGGPGTAPNGTLFQVTTNGDLTLLVSFIPSSELPSSPISGLIEATDNNYYGVGNNGIYAIRPVQRPVLRTSLQGNQINISWNAWAGYRYDLLSRTNVTDQNPFDITDFSQTIAQTNGPMSVSDTIGPDSQRFYELLLNQVH